MKIDYNRRLERIEQLHQKISNFTSSYGFLKFKYRSSSSLVLRLQNSSCTSGQRRLSLESNLKIRKSCDYSIHPELSHLIPWYNFSHTKFTQYLKKLEKDDLSKLTSRIFQARAQRITVCSQKIIYINNKYDIILLS